MPDSSSFPLLESLLRLRGLDLKPIYTIPDAAQIFGTSKRTIQEWVRDGRLAARDLPGRGRFLSGDLEAFLQASLKVRRNTMGQTDSPIEDARNRISNKRLQRRAKGK